MARLPYAAKQLIKQVQKNYPDATYEVTDEPDGLGVHRAIKFDRDTSQVLEFAFDQFLDMDERVAEFHTTDAGYTHVEFVSGPAADDQRRYPLDEAILIIASSDSEPDDDEETQDSDDDVE